RAIARAVFAFELASLDQHFSSDTQPAVHDLRQLIHIKRLPHTVREFLLNFRGKTARLPAHHDDGSTRRQMSNPCQDLLSTCLDWRQIHKRQIKDGTTAKNFI